MPTGIRLLATTELEKIVKVSAYTGDILAASEVDVIVIGIGPDLKLGPHASAINEATSGAVQRLFDCQEITGKSLECTVILAAQGISATHVVVVGLGESQGVGEAFRTAAAGAKQVTSKARQRILMAFDADWDEARQEAAVAGAIVGSVGQDIYRAEKKRIEPAAIDWANYSTEVCQRGTIIGESVNLSRKLVNLPPQDIYPESFAKEAAKVAQAEGLGIEIWDETRLAQERCEALLAVARGSSRAPRLVIAQHRGAEDDKPMLALVGKGVTFDSGGLSLKPTEGMKTMKCDMAGAATVLGALQAIARLKLPVNVVGVMGLVENMVGPDSYKLGDVLTARNGRTIEVHNTDAEGRLVLADALAVTVDLGAARIVDLATLTGACVVALGDDVAGLMANDETWCEQVKAATAYCGEYAWQLPMYPEFAKQIHSEVADIKNVGEGRWGGAITAAKFLEEFVDDVPWVHIDIAGPGFLEKPRPWIDAGGSGVMVRSLVEIARKLSLDG